MKYVLVKAGHPLNREVPIIFPSLMVHAQVAEVLGWLLQTHHGVTEWQVVSAGDVAFDRALCGGMSETLKVSSLPEDAAVIETYDYSNGDRDMALHVQAMISQIRSETPDG